MTLEQKIGQLLMVGIKGYEIDDDFVELVKKYKISNVDLYKRNIRDIAQLKKLCEDIQALVLDETGYKAFIAVDQEGGSIVRLSEDAINIPAPMALAATGHPENAYLAASINAKELQAYGVNLNFAPCADINVNSDNPIVGTRSFGDNAKQVSTYVIAALKAYQDNNLLCTIKHFPGSGDTAFDSHVELPCIDKTYEEMRAFDLIPFQDAINNGCEAIMTNHILFPKLEKEHVPATLSFNILTKLLREEMGFKGIIISDCLEMEAIKTYYGIEKAAIKAWQNGVDIVLISHTPAYVKKSVEALKCALMTGKVEIQHIDDSVKRVLQLKEKYCHNKIRYIGRDGDRETIRELRKKTIVLYHGAIFPMGDNPFFVGCSDFQSGLVSNEETEHETFAGFMSKRFGGLGKIIDNNPSDSEIEKIVLDAQNHSSLFLNTYNGHLYDGQIKLLRALEKVTIPKAIISLRNPYDLRYAPKDATTIAAWDYSKVTLELLSELFENHFIPEGIMPVKL